MNNNMGTYNGPCAVRHRIGPTKLLITLIGLVFLYSLLACGAGRPPVNLEEPYWKEDDRKPIPEPEFAEPNLLWTSVDRTLFDQGLELLDVDRSLLKISGKPTQAMNSNNFDEVPNSSWFTNRMGLPQTRLTPDEIAAGTGGTGGPDTTGPWLVYRPKIGGVTPGFWIEDIRGNKYIIKFDPKGFPDLSTGATTMAGRFFHACGYNVAEENIVYWRPENLRIREGATVKDADGTKRPLTLEDIEGVLDRVERLPDGRIRSLASLLLGNVKGPYMLKGTRKGDRNDVYPHEHRRELRGLYVLASFANHFDIKDHNSMDVYVGEDGQGHLEHYLLDFGSTFGSAGHGPMSPMMGYANLMDVRDMGVSMLTLGLKKWQWEDAGSPVNPSVGYYESEIFHPAKWDPVYPIPPFENMTDRDGYWGAKILLAFRDDHIRALIRAGRYADSKADAYLFRTMKERRDKIGRYWFGKVNPLDYPSLEVRNGGLTFSFHDLAVDYALEPGETVYQYELRDRGRTVLGPENADAARITMGGNELEALIASGSEASEERQPLLFELRIRTQRQGGRFSPPAIFWLLYQSDGNDFLITGIDHPD